MSPAARSVAAGLTLATLVVASGCATVLRRPAPPPPPAPPGAGEPIEGIASYYGRRFHGRTTASGERFDMRALTAAHRTLPFGTRVRVTNLANGRTLELTINDRGPFKRGRILDVSRRAAEELDFIRSGTTRVRLEVLDVPAPADEDAADAGDG